MTQNAGQTDLRVRRTRKLLRDALIDLTTQKGFAALTVQDITERAMVNRATFYRHFEDKYDLAMATIKETLDELGVPNKRLHLSGDEQRFDEPSPALAHLFEHIAAHAPFYRAMLSVDTFPALEAKLRAYVEQLMRQRFRAVGYDPQRARLPFDLCISAMVDTALGMIKWWLQHNMPYSAQQMALWLPQVNFLGLQYALGLDEGSR